MKSEMAFIKAQNEDTHREIAQLKDLIGSIRPGGPSSSTPGGPAVGLMSNTQQIDLKIKMNNIQQEVGNLKQGMDLILQQLTFTPPTASNKKKKKDK